MTTPTNHKSATKRKLPFVTFQATITDITSWWCILLLKNHDLSLFEEFEGVLQCLSQTSSNIPKKSPLGIRLHCLVPWQELLKQLYTDGFGIGKKKFERIQDTLVLLRQRNFPETPAEQEYKEVLMMVQTHSVLSKLHKYLSGDDAVALNDDKNKTSDDILDECEAKWRTIYLDVDHIPQSLKDLVDKTNGWGCKTRKAHIKHIVSSSGSILTYKILRNKMQKLLLRWFEHEIEGDVPELLEKGYRGIGFGDISSNKHSLSKNITSSSSINPDAVDEKIAEIKSPVEPPPKEKEKSLKVKSESKLPKDSSHSDFSCDDEKEEEVELLEMKRKRKKISKSSMIEGESLSMPASESSFSPKNKRSKHTVKQESHNIEKGRHNFDGSYSISKPSQWDSDSSEVENNIIRWSKEEDIVLENGIQRYGFGNWKAIIKSSGEIFASKNKTDLSDRAKILIGQGKII
jgi:hypothetical protein